MRRAFAKHLFARGRYHARVRAYTAHMPLDALRTPDDRFDALSDFPYAPRDLDDLAGYEEAALGFPDAHK